MKNEELTCSISGSLYFIFRIAKFYGIAPIKSEKQYGGYRISVSRTSTIINYTIITIFNIISIVALARDMSLPADKATRYHAGMRSLVWVSELLVSIIIAGIAVYGGPMRTRQDIRIISTIQKIYNDLGQLWKNGQCDVTNQRKKTYKWGLIIFTFAVFSLFDYVIFLQVCIEKNRDVVTVVLYLPYVFFYLITYLLLLQYSFITFEVCGTLVMFNDLLEKLHPGHLDLIETRYLETFSPSQKISITTLSIAVKPVEVKKSLEALASKPLAETIRYLASKYSSICDIVRQTDSSHGFGHLMLLLICLLRLIMTPYNLIVNIVGEKLHVTLLAAQMVWAVLHVVSVVALIEPCHQTHREIDRTNLLVGKLILQDIDQLACEELEKFYQFLSLNAVSYAPLGICTLSRGLLASIAGTVCTYLVIIFQFQVSDGGEY